MKVLMLGWELPPHNSGGLGQACFDLCKSLSNQNVDIEFILPYISNHDIDFMKVTSAFNHTKLQKNVLHQAYDSINYTYSSKEHELFEETVDDLISDKTFDIVHAHDWLTFRAAIRIKERTNLPIILHVHSIESDRAGGQRGNELVRDIEEYCLKLADKVIAVSEHTKQAIIREYSVPSENIEVVHNSINTDDIIPLSGINSYRYIELMKEKGYKVAVNFGRLTIQKGLSNLIEAMHKVVAKHPKSLLLIIGSGEQYFDLIKLSADLGISSHVLFADFQRGKKLRDGIAIGDLFVMPSISEPFGLTALEAIGYGTPAMVSKQSGVSEIVKNMLKVDFWDIDEMANKIATAFENPELLDELLDKSSSEIQNISWDQSSMKIKNLYEVQLGVGF
ncbi:glycosyltransferase family 1 protein [bacterium]|nr:glycosyltransferase family 1 protein [bacterium]